VTDIQKIGAYKIVRMIGKGGMGRVYEAINEQIQRRVAIKVLHAQFAENSMVVQRFLNEARAVNIVKHRCLVDIYEFGLLEDGSAYIVMEYLEGDTLHERLWKRGGKLPTDVAIRYTRQIALALAAAHAKEIIHRDLKPANIMLVEDPETGSHDWVKVLDFGLARVREPDSDDGRLTQTGIVMGTPSYMSPEQIRSARSVVDRSDVYTLGLMFYEMLSGLKPFRAASDAEIMFMHMSAEPQPLREVAPGLPPQLCSLVHRMLKKNPAERPSASEVASSLVQFGSQPSLSGLATVTAPAKPSGGAELGYAATVEMPAFNPPEPVAVPEAASTATGVAVQRTKRPPPRPPAGNGLLMGLGLGMILLLILGGASAAYFAFSGKSIPFSHKPKPAEAERVSWSIRSVPAGAEVIGEDGRVLGLTPFASQRPKQGGAKMLLLRKDGYNTAHVTCESSADCERETMLVAQPVPPPTSHATETTPAKESTDKAAKPDGHKKQSKKTKKSKPPSEPERPVF